MKDPTNEKKSVDIDPLVDFYTNNWNETWSAFLEALRSTEEFYAVYWVLKLAKAGIRYSYVKSGLYKLKVHRYWRSWVPAFGIALVTIIVASYYGSLREVVEDRWCSVDEENGCRWLSFHDVVVLYFGVMILFNLVSACFRSPGVALAKQNGKGDLQADASSNEIERWSSIDSRGGFCGIDPILNAKREAILLRNYYAIAGTKTGSSATNKQIKSTDNQYFPGLGETFCNKCKIRRPPRCHHCSVCNRCILQFDHHCAWLNNCVGYNNHRAFVLTLFYLSVGCCYGVLMLYRPFLESLQATSESYGGNSLHNNIQALLHIPSATGVFYSISGGTLEKDDVVKLVFPFLTAIGLLQTVFLGYHVRYIMSAFTTLESKILLDLQYKQMLENQSTRAVPRNPFSRGWMQNLKTALGPIPLLFLPIQVDPNPAAFVLEVESKKK